MAERQEALALFVFIGGLSAATGMVIVETIALSTMVCNDLVMPVLLRWKALRLHEEQDLSGLLLSIRRWAIAAILLLGYIYFRAAGEAYALVGIGLISFAAVAQFAPAIIGGIYWKGGTRQGAIAGLAGRVRRLDLHAAAARPLQNRAGCPWISSRRACSASPCSSRSSSSGWPAWMIFPTACSGACSPISAAMSPSPCTRRPDVVETSQGTLFVDVFRHTDGAERSRFWRGSAQVQDLLPLIGRFLGPERAREAFLAYARRRKLASIDELQADADLVHYAETLLAGAIGGASARVMVASVVKEEPLGIDEVMNILDEASQVRAYSRQLEQKSRELEAATAELRAANERLKEVDRMKDDFMSTVTHELRTPLTSIRAFSEILLEDPKTDLANRKKFLAIIVKETERLTRLINQVLDMAKIESGNAEWHTAEIDLHEVIEESVAATSSLFGDKRISLDMALTGDVPKVMADRDRLIQVMLNLLSNAVKFCEADRGRVAVKLSAGGDAVRVDVEDNGPGISEQDQHTIFEKFRQVGDTMTAKPQGTGLGLPISRQIIEHFGGRLWVESSPGTGGDILVYPALEQRRRQRHEERTEK